MKFEHVIFPEKRCIVQKLSGYLALEGVMAASTALWEDPQFDKNYSGICDLREADFAKQPDEIQKLQEFFQSEDCSEGIWAVIVSDPRGTALNMIFQSTNPGPFKMQVFSSWEAACEFLKTDIAPHVFSKPVNLKG